MSAHENAPDGEAAPTPAETPRRRSTGRRVLVGVAALLVVALVAGAAFVVVTVRRPLPQAGGEIQLSGLDAEVTVLRDAQGVPHVYADTPEDLFRAQGYVQAQDRFFEMDYRRHVTAGRLAELVGDNPDAIAADKVTRTFGWREVAEAEWEVVEPETQAYLQAYAEGVNAYLDDRSPGELGLEYTVLGLQVEVTDPEPWDPIDSLAWLKAMAWDLRGNYDDELERALAYGTMQDTARVAELFPAYPSDVNAPILQPGELENPQRVSADLTAEGEETFASDHLQAAVEAADRALDAVPVLIGRGEGTGSNSWVVSGEHTATGQPILANDPHLSLGAPGIWAQVGLHCTEVGPDCGFDVAGFSFAGFPGVVIGHNAQVAWGLTNMGADVTDFFIERVRDDTYLRGDEWVPLETRTETLRVAGGEDVELEIRSTVHGPVVSGVVGELDAVTQSPVDGTRLGEYAVALQWTALEPGRTADAVFAFNLAADAEDMQAAAALFEVPAQNIVFATTDGQIGYQAPGKIPVRGSVSGPVASDGSWPRPGWDERYDWQGYVPSEQMPRVVDPAEGFVVAANQAVLPAGVEPFLTTDWDYGYRAQRIRQLLQDEIAAGREIDVDTMNEIQVDDRSPYAEVLVPILLDQEIDDDFAAQGQELLADWDYRTDTDSAAAAYFAAVWRNLLELTFWDDLPESARPNGGSRWLAVVQGLVDNPTDAFWDDRETVSVVETRDEVLTQALVSARLDLTVEQSKEPDDWRWGNLHVLALQHPVLGGESIPAPVRDYVNPDPVGMPGGSSIVNATAWDAASGSFEVTAGPSMRMVVDLDDLDRSTWVTVTGTSGHPASRHYDDQLATWARGETFAWPFGVQAVADAAEDELTLVP
ncbi:penicillin acylase family protein [Cellulosimicrobium marinum]|uniref:penicillin acylase family protein n=1 Tax=Cellulosimicrobium marinum TaxID=1638992 RepID=UPI001E3ACEC8|nr:penicillin acylase family protein [Cellulosimicrobium marinum]MCB7136979.1 penicillin acylase family protein [Cellulosimicrobium marinum]